MDKIIVVADDSHGIGVVGDNGGGVFKTLLALGAREIIVCCSLGKGFGLQAGAVFGTKKRIQSMTETAFYGGASPATPATLATILDTGEILANKREKLNKRMLQFRKQLPENHNFSIMDGHPAISFANKEFTDYLEKNNIVVTNFPYPNEDSSTMSRIVLSSSHKKKDLSKLSHLIKKYFSAQI